LRKEIAEMSQTLKLKETRKEKRGSSDSLELMSAVNFPNLNISDGQKINIEYLKNVLLKYLEAIAIGNEFQIKILENVIFTVLSVTKKEKANLEEKRQHSSFYYNLWYNAKAFLAAKIYGEEVQSTSISMNDIHSEELEKNIQI
jgi:hypothetical protein